MGVALSVLALDEGADEVDDSVVVGCGSEPSADKAWPTLTEKQIKEVNRATNL